MKNTIVAYLVASCVSIAVSGCAGEARQYENGSEARQYENGSEARQYENGSEARQYENAYKQISESPTKYLSIIFYPVNNSGKVDTTTVVKSTLRKEGEMSAALMAYLLAEEGRVDTTRIRVAPVIESKADIPLEVKFDAILHYEKHVYNSMYKYTPEGGHGESIQKISRSVNVLLNPREKLAGEPIDFGELTLREAGKTWIADLEIKRKIKSIDAENITIKRPPESYLLYLVIDKNTDTTKHGVKEIYIEQDAHNISAVGRHWKGQ